MLTEKQSPILGGFRRLQVINPFTHGGYVMEKEGNIKDVMAYFGFKKVSDFRNEWTKLDENQQNWFKSEVAKVIG